MLLIKDRGYFWQLTNEEPKPGDLIKIDLEHGSSLGIVDRFVPGEQYPLFLKGVRGGCRWGGTGLYRDGRLDMYGIMRVVWTDHHTWKTDRKYQAGFHQDHRPVFE